MGALLYAFRESVTPRRYVASMEAQHIGPILGMQLFVAPIAYFIWATGATIYSIVFDHAQWLRRWVIRQRRDQAMRVDSWFMFGTTWAVLNGLVYIYVTTAF